jgi:hypothetical protein
LLERRYGKKEPHYLDIQLYRSGAENERYPMSWAISAEARERMRERLDTHDELAQLIRWMNTCYQDSLRPESHQDPEYRRDLNIAPEPIAK